MNKERLLKLADFLQELPKDKFDFTSVVEEYDRENECGTLCCAIGWTPAVFPDLVKWLVPRNRLIRAVEIADDRGHAVTGYVAVASELFTIPQTHARVLFTPASRDEHGYYIPGGSCIWFKSDTWREEIDYPQDVELLPYSATPQELAGVIRSYVKAIEAREVAV